MTKKITYKEAKQRFEYRDDIELCEEGYDSFDKKAKFYDKIIKDFWMATPKKVLINNSCHPKRKSYNQSLWKKEINCVFCNDVFIPKLKEQKFCSRKCSMFFIGKKKTELQTFETNCSWCNKTIRKRLSQKGKTGDFCSKKCSEAFIRGNEEKYIIKNCENCNKEFNSLYRQKIRFCSSTCKSSGKFNGMYGKKYTFKEGRKAWTYGLTAKTDERLSNIGKKISIIQKEQFENGIRSNCGENNPNHTNNRKQKERTEEQLERYSKAAIQRVINNQVPINRSAKTGYYFSNKMKQNLYFRSLLELRAMICLDNDKNIISFEYEPFVIVYYDKNNIKRRYLPDLLVSYNNNKTILVEVKPNFQLNDEIVLLKKAAAEKYISNKGWMYSFWDKEYIEKYENNLNIKNVYKNYFTC